MNTALHRTSGRLQAVAVTPPLCKVPDIGGHQPGRPRAVSDRTSLESGDTAVLTLQYPVKSIAAGLLQVSPPASQL